MKLLPLCSILLLTACNTYQHPYENPDKVLTVFKEQHASAQASKNVPELAALTSYVPIGHRSAFVLYAYYTDSKRNEVGKLQASVNVFSKKDINNAWTVLETVAEQWQESLDLPAHKELAKALQDHQIGHFVVPDSSGYYQIDRKVHNGETIRLHWRTAAYANRHPGGKDEW